MEEQQLIDQPTGNIQKAKINWKTLQPFFVVVGGAVDHLFLGCFYLWGNIAPYVNSYLYHMIGDSITPNSTLAVVPLSSLAIGMFSPFGAFL